MKSHLRIALPPLVQWHPAQPLPYAWFDRQGRVAQSGELDAAALATAFRPRRIEAVLHPHDAIVTTVQVPPVAPRQRGAAVESAIEALLLGDIDSVAVAFGTREPNGTVVVAWTDKQRLHHVWDSLAGTGLRLDVVVPTASVLPPDDTDHHQPLQLPVSPRWQHPAPRWGWVVRSVRDTRRQAWRWPIALTLAAAVLWVIGLNLYASRLKHDVDTLRATMTQRVQATFPELPVVVDPLRQAEQGRNALLNAGGTSTANDLVPLALAAARVLPAADDRVTRMQYSAAGLLVTLRAESPATGGASSLGSGGTAGATASGTLAAKPMAPRTEPGIRVDKTETPNTWRIVSTEAP
ncbi:type II secretion system protein GspL [Alcaligenaceae bacterium B3P038]|nr:type II secretion system protein GspL [Alcaligenaceae bacterium B3P038]